MFKKWRLAKIRVIELLLQKKIALGVLVSLFRWNKAARVVKFTSLVRAIN